MSNTHRPRKPAGISEGGQFTTKETAVDKQANKMFIGTVQAIAARNELEDMLDHYEQDLQRPDLTLRDAATTYVEANAVTAVLMKRRDNLASAICKAEHDLSPSESITLRDSLRNRTWKLVTGKSRARPDEEGIRNDFLEEAKNMTPEEVGARSRQIWTDSGWGPSALSQEGIRLRDVATVEVKGAAVVPDLDTMGDVTRSYEDTVDTAIQNADEWSDSDRFFVAAELHEKARIIKAMSEDKVKDLSGWEENDPPKSITGSRTAKGYVQNACTVRADVSYKGWQAGEILEKLKEKADGDGYSMGKMISAARPPKTFRANARISHTDPPHVSVVSVI